MEHFDRIQTCVLAHYNGGEHLVESPQDVPNCGDGLLSYLLTELSEKEDCTDFPEALRRIKTSIEQLYQLQDVIENEAMPIIDLTIG